MLHRFTIPAPLIVILAAAISATSFAASGDYKAGESEPYKKWTGRKFEDAKVAGMPMLVYFCDPDPKRNDLAKFLETKVLAMAEVKEKMKSFLVLKIKTDGTDYVGWPQEWLSKAKNGAAIMLATSDMTQTIFYDKSTPKDFLSQTANVTNQMAAVLQYEEKKKAAAEKAAPPKKEVAAEKENKPLPGLALDKEKEKKDDKAAPPKKKVAGPADE